MLSEEHRNRYKDTIAHLKQIASGAATLDTGGAAGGGDGEVTPPDRPRPIVTGGPEREFTREKMRGL